MVANHHLNNGNMKDELHNGRASNGMDSHHHKSWEATEKEFDKLIAEQECFEILLREEKVKNQDLQNEIKRAKKDGRKHVLRLESDIQQLRKTISHRDAAIEEAQKQIALQKAQIEEFKEKLQASSEPVVQITGLPPLPASKSASSQVDGSFAQFFTTSSVNDPVPLTARPPLPINTRRKISAPSFVNMRAMSLQEESLSDSGIVLPRTEEEVEEDKKEKEVETGSVLSLSIDSVPQSPSPGHRQPMLEKCRRTASMVSRLIQGFEAVAAQQSPPPTREVVPRRRTVGSGGNFRNFTFSVS